jgi:hypothetical protein
MSWLRESDVRAAVAVSLSYAEVLRRLGLRAAGGNHRTVRKYVEEIWRIPIDHFDPHEARRRASAGRAVPLAEVLVEGSTYHRGHLKRRLLAEGLKRPECEMCGQGELWRGRHMALVLDHINGVHDDHRLENLRILCPNCNATLDTHCGRHNKRRHPDRTCPVCAVVFRPANGGQQYCSLRCAGRGERSRRAQMARAHGRTAPSGPAHAGGRRTGLSRGRAQIRRQRQRDPQVATRVRARARVGCREPVALAR